MKDLYNYCQIIKGNPEQTFAIATVIQVEGSAYRHEGAKMLFSSSGESFGLVSGGCLEEDLKYHANEVIATGMTKQISYNLLDEEDSGWGRGAGCNGMVTLFVEPLQWSDIYIKTIDKALQQGSSVISVRKMNETSNVPYWVLEEKDVKQAVARLQDGKLQQALLNFTNERGCSLKLVTATEGGECFLIEKIEGPDSLFIFGAGRDVEPLVDMAANLSFSPIVIDPREERCDVAFFPRAKDLFVQHPCEFLEETILPSHGFVVIMTHDFQKDKGIINHILDLKVPPKYVAILGPRERTKRIVGEVEIPEWLHSPAGMNIHGETPEEIAVSIIGELIKVRNQEKYHYRQKKKRKQQYAKENING
ncbi:MAG: XdhC family protein [Bacillus sp. (in: Bacteria)]|nr:XdhC family protein [Bacillus sp. (in: firmicutes)]